VAELDRESSEIALGHAHHHGVQRSFQDRHAESVAGATVREAVEGGGRDQSASPNSGAAGTDLQ
jgi:hypothetical protein